MKEISVLLRFIFIEMHVFFSFLLHSALFFCYIYGNGWLLNEIDQPNIIIASKNQEEERNNPQTVDIFWQENYLLHNFFNETERGAPSPQVQDKNKQQTQKPMVLDKKKPILTVEPEKDAKKAFPTQKQIEKQVKTSALATGPAPIEAAFFEKTKQIIQENLEDTEAIEESIADDNFAQTERFTHIIGGKKDKRLQPLFLALKKNWTVHSGLRNHPRLILDVVFYFNDKNIIKSYTLQESTFKSGQRSSQGMKAEFKHSVQKTCDLVMKKNITLKNFPKKKITVRFYSIVL